jgi:hypothetical protein
MRAPTVLPAGAYGLATAAVAVALCSAEAKLDVLGVDVDVLVVCVGGANARLISAIRAITESRLTK